MTNSTIAEPLTLQPELTSPQNSPVLFLDETVTRLSTQRDSCRICGDLEDEGIAIEWRNSGSEFERAFEWPGTFHSECLALCLNFAGHGALYLHDNQLNFKPLTAFVYVPSNRESRVWRRREERHRFLTVGFSACFLRDELAVCEEALHPVVRDFMFSVDPVSTLGTSLQLTREHERLVSLLLRSQCSQGPCQLKCKGIVLQLMADLLVAPCCSNEASCDRQKCLALERARKVVAILERDLAAPPTLEEIGHEVGCSPFHLSRQFSREMGMTIPQCIRTLRMRYAAELLKSGKCNVTEAAMAVGYSSLSHFSQAFCQAIGCCPTMYASAAPDQTSTTCAAFRADVSNRNQQPGERSGHGIDVLLESIR